MKPRPRCAALVAALLITGCGAAPGEGRSVVKDSAPLRDEPAAQTSADSAVVDASGRWEIIVNGIWEGDVEGCLADRMIATTWATASYPSSALGAALVAEASEADAIRIAECLRAALPANEVNTRWMAEAMPLPQGPPVTGGEPVGPDPVGPEPAAPSADTR